MNITTREGNLLLVNADFAFHKEDKSDLVSASQSHPKILVKRIVAEALQLIFQKIGCEECVVPVSGYRSAEEQTQIYETSLRENGEGFTKKFVALPYHSEHQTGLAIDLGLKQEEVDFICPEFPYEGICNEFRKVAINFGFIERYPEGKEHITGIAHEPWHFRYVGCPHSKIMSQKSMTLEEYLLFVKGFSQKHPYVWSDEEGNVAEIFYMGAETTDISMPDDCTYQVSGNNMDGFVVTLWRCSDE